MAFKFSWFSSGRLLQKKTIKYAKISKFSCKKQKKKIMKLAKDTLVDNKRLDSS
jgi:hypothetical protein